jgi:hypothetical protein
MQKQVSTSSLPLQHFYIWNECVQDARIYKVMSRGNVLHIGQKL